MRSLANPLLNIVTPVDLFPVARRVVKRKRPHYRGSKSGLIGVCRVSHCPNKPWKAYLRDHGQYRTIGYFRTKEEAAIAYNAEACHLFGADTQTNKVAKSTT